MSTPLLEVKNLNVYYDNIHTIKNINFHINEGEIVSIIGANGAGKSTTLKTISGMLKSKSGSVSLLGKDITNKSPEIILKQGMAHVPEGRRIFANLPVSDNIKLGSYSLNESPENLKQMRKEYYDRFPVLRERKAQLAGTLSGGEQQMLAIGRALMSKPKLLILDEPSMGLSPLFVQQVFDLLVELKENGTTILLVEQNANKALQISDRAYVLETGSITISGKANELRENPDVKKAYLGA